MSFVPSASSSAQKPLRLWPGVAAALLLLLVRFVLPLIRPEAAATAFMGGAAIGLIIVFWWLFGSRAPWLERLSALALIFAGIFATRLFLHPSIAGAGMGFLFYLFVLPTLGLALVAGALITRRFTTGARRATMAALLLAGSGWALLLRTGGISGSSGSDFAWRWSPTPEERLLAEGGEEPRWQVAPAPAGSADTVWPGYRGPARDGVHRGAKIEADWAQAPPKELWRRPVGPGWSSFAVAGDRFFTQEQRGEDEVVSCYSLATGEPIWRHGDNARFYESNAGAGPRATPTLAGDRLYTLGATGILNALDARDGSLLWSRNAAADTGAKLPGWGFSGSPLVVGDLVVAATSGVLAAYDLETGTPRWKGSKDGHGYSSPHLATIAGTDQVLLLQSEGIVSVSPQDGAALWQYAWPGDGIVQPALTADGDLLLGAGSGMGGNNGVHRVSVARGTSGWTVTERWTSIFLKPYFSDFVVHEGHAYGFDGSILAAIDLADGSRKWKGGRYGHGQLLLLPEQDLLLVVSEKGELALVEAKPDQFTERARIPAIQGKTWNHPVLAGDTLLVRNAEEMAAFRLARVGG